MNARRRQPAHRRHLLLVTAVLALAFFLRVHRLTEAPVGINGDELFNAVDAWAIGPGNWPVFFPGNQGREAFFLYLMAFSMRLLGKSIFAFRLPAALLGTGNVLLAYLLGRDLFRRRVGLLAAGLTAVSLWPLMASRWGLRAVSLTFCTALTLFLLHRALHTGRRRVWILGGAALGLTLYTYLPARLFPLVVLAWLAWVAWRRPDQWRRQWRHVLLALGAALLVFAPFGLYMVRHPDRVNQRLYSMRAAYQDALEGDIGALQAPVTAVARMFSFQGDDDWRYHVSGKPVFDPLTSLFFYAGLLVCLGRSFRPASARGGPAASHALLWLWLGAMLAPNAVLDANSSFLRAAGAVIPTYLLTAVGIDAAVTWVHQRRPGWRRRYPVWTALALLGLALMLRDTWISYFTVWNNHPTVRDVYQGDLAAMGRHLASQGEAEEGARVFIGHPYAYDAAPRTLAYYTTAPVSWFAPAQTMVWAGAGPVVYLLPLDAPLPEPLPAGAAVTTVPFADGAPAFARIAVDGRRLDASPAQPLTVRFPAGPTLAGYDLPPTVMRGEDVPLVLHWQVPDGPSPPTALLYAQATLVDADGNDWSQARGDIGYPQASWQPGDRFRLHLSLPVPAGLPPGPVRLRFELSDAGGALIPAQDENGSPAFVTRGQPLAAFTPGPDMPIFDDRIVLRQATLSTLVEPGLPVNIALDWLPLRAVPVDYAVRFRLLQPGNPEPILVQDAPILPDTFPTSRWQPREPVRSLHQLFIPADVSTAATDLSLEVALVPIAGGAPLPLTGGVARVAGLTLVVRTHRYDVPPISRPLAAQFGPAITLLGYDLDLDQARPGGEVRLTLIWQARDTPAGGYTVFNHLLGPDGQLYGQFDSPPVSEAWLTATWLPGEVVVDRRVIPVAVDAPAGSYAVAVGLYTASDGRLPVTVDGQPQPQDQLTLPPFSLGP